MEQREKVIKHNILLSFINKGLSIIISLLLVSATIGYLDIASYGVWLTVSSVVTWAGYFDLGIQHGFRNHLTRAISNRNNTLAKELVSTSYALIILIYFLIGTTFIICNAFIDWKHFLNILLPNSVLHYTFLILAISFVVQSVLNLIQTILYADQKPAYAALIYTLGQLCVLLAIFLLVRIRNSAQGSILTLSFITGGIPNLVFVFFSIILFRTIYKDIAPNCKHIRFKLSNKILGLGIKFFFIQLSLLLIFQSASIIITRNIGPEATTVYNVAYRYLGVIYMISVIILTPYWSAFTDAYERHDYNWMTHSYKKLNKIWSLCIPIVIFLIIISQFVYRVWLKDSVYVPWSTTVFMGVYMVCMSRGALFMYLLNGIGEISIQMCIYLLFACISVPVMNWLSLRYGLNSIIGFGAFVYLIQAIIGEVQLVKLLRQNE